jgi:hypothetical protein
MWLALKEPIPPRTHIMNNLNRRKFIKDSSVVGLGALTLNMLPSQLFANDNQLLGKLPYAPLQSHLLNRSSFGINSELIDKYQQLGYKGFIDYQLNPDDIDDSEIEDYINENLVTVNMPLAEIRKMIDNEQINQITVANQLKAATFLRAAYSKKQLLQVMVEFWSNHFSVFHLDGPVIILKTLEDRDVIRPNALSTFSALLHADAKSTAMIYYLDTFASNKEAPNENYARELMELHTLGVDGPFVHNDIDEIARCFTGWGINQATGEFRFFQNRHDFNQKLVLNNIIAAGGGITDGEQVVDILASHSSTASFISNKLCQHFIADNPDKSIVESTTSVFINTNGDIKQCLRHILLSKHFMISRDLKFKRPFNYLVSAVRTLGGDILNRQSTRPTRNILETLGQLPFAWQTPDGYPDQAAYWESTTGMLFRWNFVNAFCFNELQGYDYSLNQIINLPHNPENVFLQITEKILNREMNPDDEQALMQYLSEESVNNIVPIIKIQGALAIAMGSPYYQLF